MGVVIRRYIDFLILLIPTLFILALFCSSIPTSFVHSFIPYEADIMHAFMSIIHKCMHYVSHIIKRSVCESVEDIC